MTAGRHDGKAGPMTRQLTEMIREEGRRWALRAADPDFSDWDALTDWLEADPAHLDAYDAALDDDDWARRLFLEEGPEVAPVVAANDMGGRGACGRARRTALSPDGRLGCILAAGGRVGRLFRAAPRTDDRICNRAGQRHEITLADGSQILLNGGTRIRFSPSRPREIEMKGGEILFRVHHDADHPFVVTSGNTRLVDVGTVFDVQQQAGVLDVAVAEGAVLYNARGGEIRLGAGTGSPVPGTRRFPFWPRPIRRQSAGGKPMCSPMMTRLCPRWWPIFPGILAW
jgi:transmembrane sensor